MITTVADLLEALVEREKSLLAKQPKLNHAPMLGDMYEGLARTLVERVLFKGLNLRVVEGKIEDSEGKLSDQIDCMIVEGDGHQLPHTDHYIYPYASVIAVMEIKKSFLGEELSDSFFHLRGVKDEKVQPQKHVYHLLRDAWRSLVGSDLPEREEVKGWGYRSLEASEKELDQSSNSYGWEPAILTLAEFVLLNELCSGQQVRLDNAETVAYLTEQGTTNEAICQSLTEKRLAYEKAGQLHLLTDQCQCAILPDGRYVAGENKSGRLMRWVFRFSEQHKLKVQSSTS